MTAAVRWWQRRINRQLRRTMNVAAGVTTMNEINGSSACNEAKMRIKLKTEE